MLRRFLVFSILVLSLVPSGVAQDKEKIKQLTPSTQGSTGLFHLYLADTLRRGEMSVGLNTTHFNREPGDLDFTLFPATFAVGLHDRVEFFISWETHRRVNGNAIRVNKIGPGDPIGPARLDNSMGSVGLFNDSPFLDVSSGEGSGELRSGVKFNLLSDLRGDPVGVAVQSMIKFPLSDSRTRLLQGRTNGTLEAGYDLILSKNLPRGGTVTGHYGHLFAGDSQGIPLQHRMNYGLGFGLPIGSGKVRAIGELVGSHFFGERIQGANPKSPVDLYLGLRISFARWISISAAYNLNLNTINGDLPIYGIPSTGRSGWFLQVTFQRKINRAPTIRCNPDRAVIAEGDSANIQAVIVDSDNSLLSLTWRASAGRISQQGTRILFDSTGLQVGEYTLTAEVGDGDRRASCTADIIVESRSR
jgi:hypothetical protein